MNIILIGYMGSGKSTVGKLLAAQLQMNFIDADAEIEKEEGIAISEIFKSQGEAHFRALEVEFLLHNEFENSVIATGGGMPCFHNNMSRLNLLGTTVYLSLDAGTLVDHLLIESESKKRPLISANNRADLIREINSRLAVRKDFYEQSLLTINAGLSVDKIVNDVLSNLSKEAVKR
jgi:shikimate kinase